MIRRDSREGDRVSRPAVQRASLGALCGLLAAGIAVGIGELVAAFVRPAASPIIAVGNKFVLLTPESLKQYAIRTFGSNDKHVLLLGIYSVITLLALVLGVIAVRRLWLAIVGFVGFGAVGIWSAATANAAQAPDVIPTIVATAAAIAVLVFLVRALPPAERAEPDNPTEGEPSRSAEPTSRRTFLAGSVGAAVVAGGAGALGRRLQHSGLAAQRSRRAVRLPRPASPAPALPAGVDLHGGAVPFVTSNANFYRVDTALTVPELATDTWRLRIHGMVDREITLSYDELLHRPMIERYITMACVSDDVGGPYISTAKFLGVPLAPLLREVGVHATADQMVGTSSDGMTIGTPTAVIMDGRDAMLAVGMNDEPLPLAHGFPCRTVVPGLYGYVSATKWLVDLEATTFAAYDPYWVQRGWARTGPIRVESRIDTPRGRAVLKAGQTLNVGGVAWHPHIGIKAVQVRIDNGPWQQAELGRVPSIDTWVQWRYRWTVAGSGPVTLQVRAIDADGTVQDEQRRDVFPSGATGWHSVVVDVA